MQTIIYLVRHGNSVANAEKFFGGHIDVELTELGVEQASYVTEYFKDKHLDVVYSSDSIRAVNTVKGAANDKGLEIITSENLREINGGDWEGKPHQYLRDNYPEYALWYTGVHTVKTPNGESVIDLATRSVNEITKIAKLEPNKTVLVGTHETPIRAIIALLGYGYVEKMNDVRFPNCAILKLGYNGEKFTILEECITEHLHGAITFFPRINDN